MMSSAAMSSACPSKLRIKRCRSAAVATLQYSWPVWGFLDGIIQADVGNVFGPHLEGFAADAEMRIIHHWTKPGVSFIVPAYNCAQYLPDTIQSIENGNLERDDEIIIVDDASTDETRQVMDELAAKNGQIRTIHHRFNKRTGHSIVGPEFVVAVERQDLA